MKSMEDILKSLPNTFIPIFVAINVFMLLPLFVSITRDLTRPKRSEVVKESILTAFLVSLSFIALGEVIFRILGITGDDFKTAGGLLLLVFAVRDLIHSGEERIKSDYKVGVVPIGVPLIVGPAVLTNILILVDHYGIIPTVISLLLNLLIVWVALSNAERMLNFFGRGFVIAIGKVMLLFLAAIAIMMIRIGVINIIKSNFNV
jgi:multiple antibiotic resistance protein